MMYLPYIMTSLHYIMMSVCYDIIMSLHYDAMTSLHYDMIMLHCDVTAL